MHQLMAATLDTVVAAIQHELKMPDFRDYAVKVPNHGVVEAEATRVQGRFIRDVLQINADAHNFRVFSPDETAIMSMSLSRANSRNCNGWKWSLTKVGKRVRSRSGAETTENSQ
jgi:phosphoketolase